MKKLLLILPLILLYYSCATVEELAEGDTTEETVVDDQRPEWYDYTNRSYADSLTFIGVGLASAVDSNTSYEKALTQAEANLKLSIDTYAEEVRVERAENPGGERFNSSEFIINLRNAVQDLSLSEEMDITSEHIEKSDSVHHTYVKAVFPIETAVQALDEALQIEEFTHALNDR